MQRPRIRTVALAAVVAAGALPAVAGAAPGDAPTFDGPAVIAPPPDYASEVHGDPWDYRNLDDVLLDGDGPTLNVTGQTLRNGRLAFDIDGSGYVSPVWTGFTGAIPAGREGTRHPIDATRYRTATFRMYASSQQPAALFWFRCDALEDRCTGGKSFMALPGWNTYEVALENTFPGLTQEWGGEVLGLRMSFNTDRATSIELDWMRLHGTVPGTTIRWDNPAPGSSSTLHWDRDADRANNTAGEPGWGSLATTSATTGSATLPAGMEPGTYRFYATAGGTTTGYSAPLTIDAPPLPVITDPDEAGGEDHATAVLGDAWDMSQTTDVAQLGNAANVSWSGGVLEATNGGPVRNDPFLILRQDATIDPARYHRLTVNTTYDGPFGLEDAEGGGAHGRWLWRRQDQGQTFQNGREIVTYTTVDTYTIDLATTPSGAIAESGPGWLGSPITTVRYDPNEDRGARRWRVDEISLRADDETTDRTFDITWHDDAHATGTTVDLYADRDGLGFDGQLIASGIAQTSGVNTYRWVADDVTDGTYWIHLRASDGVSTSRTYATGPVRVSGTAPVARPDATARSTDPACPPGSVPEDGATDVPDGNPHEDAIDCVTWWAVAKGTGAGTYAPGREVNRAQMATFIAQAIESAGGSLPVDPPDAFDDDDGGTHERATDQLAAVGIVGGVGERTYAPGRAVTRAQMASFLAAAVEHLLGGPLADGGDHFADDDASVHVANIDRVAAAGLATGTGGDRYAPGRPVRRDQMASFITRTLALFVDDGGARPPA